MVGLVGRVVSSSKGLYLHRTTQHKTDEDKHPWLERDSNPRALKARASDRPATRSAQCWVKNSNYEVHYYAVFSVFLLLPRCWIQRHSLCTTRSYEPTLYVTDRRTGNCSLIRNCEITLGITFNEFHSSDSPVAHSEEPKATTYMITSWPKEGRSIRPRTDTR
jgi:hypothetical protein